MLVLSNDLLFNSEAGGRSRLAAIRAELDGDGTAVKWRDAALCPRASMARVHTGKYLRRLEELRGRAEKVYAHRTILPGSMAAIASAAGAAVGAVTAVCSGEATQALVVVEPPGHHAEADRGMGFCAVNNVAVAVAHALGDLGCRRVLVVDWDVHHGNGTQRAFEDRSDVLFFDCHQDDLFPGSGAVEEVGHGAGEGYTVNVPLPPAMTDDDYVSVFDRVLAPRAEAFAPDLVVVSAGFDAHAEDPLGGMAVSENGFARLCAVVAGIARAYSANRMVLVLEGGYNATAVARSIGACVRVLAGHTVPAKTATPGAACESVIERVRALHGL